MSRCCSGVGAASERQFSEKRATKDLAQYRTKGPGSTARLLTAGIAKAGQPHGRLLDIGSGVGALTFEQSRLRLVSDARTRWQRDQVRRQPVDSCFREEEGTAGDLVGRPGGRPLTDFVTVGDHVTVSYRQSGSALNAVDVRIDQKWGATSPASVPGSEMMA